MKVVEFELIDRAKLWSSVRADPKPIDLGMLAGHINNAPVVEVVPKSEYEQVKSERDSAIAQLKGYGVQLGEEKELASVVHGRWKAKGHAKICSVCAEPYFGAMPPGGYNYCPTCGAKMDGAQHEPH